RETSYDIDALWAYTEQHEPKLLPEQRAAYDEIVASVCSGTGKIFFLDVPGGTYSVLYLRITAKIFNNMLFFMTRYGENVHLLTSSPRKVAPKRYDSFSCGIFSDRGYAACRW